VLDGTSPQVPDADSESARREPDLPIELLDDLA
jgi:hypothetical protein